MDIEIIKKHIDDVLVETNFTNLGKKKIGKVRDIYVAKNTVTLISTDRHSSFDRIIAHVPFKGEVLNQISLFWFDKTKDIIENHVFGTPDPNVVVAKKCTPLPIECVVRGYITGVTSTSLWTHYKEGKRNFGNFVLPEGIKKNQKLPEPVFTPTTKSEDHDRPITPDEIVSEGLLSLELTQEIERVAKTLFKRGQEIALEQGWLLVDTKYEFGLDQEGKLILIDEIHTPDSSRYWKAESYDERFNDEQEPEYFDKEFLRLWFKDNCDPYKDKTLPKAPTHLIAELSRRYIEIYETITGKPFNHDLSQPTKERVAKNLKNKL
ncbi:phosphoribosylaminoimidazolesuccinocarboxamide synthase [Candidatus Nomurabacteria bacterium RIFCSPHIGHO2_02_FULL_41_18]|uniref:Phosphoribosylaminoimidazole-succinocarboxamide synthase n=1 Tax=Candidatus Nomurabacteria bacterium RIFCSPHIGHO2_02_FULL_41_18 TaxID=1801754 RepID=A0A1F6W746_9BACT|nr:MAG: phosphoribosylaminoimidazolesuccinocarboxamide synthase [Candidatus Nomurabacteria bacterium RIFCSPHIGHO2_01_FULL_41_71]OGI77586.1 MAG: phosphoribosylaminoimidazolesuccinocarboxamide synthase [Candidatus Nomurabacteria bacterium RIFCSPHIGHO2_02_FULL_41_18]OGI89086.1 MAG: phosphoribosylaminoimidazolesuccinocarboxamide synthase [Candidatus Nomurabacteria bacterium RIFCSPLOWO2_01_FULL_41_52b]OGJ00381.1 MAG: phosphoribosylaminoimidazolesuccinocarboxamide synthase [Candidatus Nomurabacteria b